MLLYHPATLWAYGIVSCVNFTLSVFLISYLQRFPIFIFFYTVVYIPHLLSPKLHSALILHFSWDHQTPPMFPVIYSSDTFGALLILKLLWFYFALFLWLSNSSTYCSIHIVLKALWSFHPRRIFTSALNLKNMYPKVRTMVPGAKDH